MSAPTLLLTRVARLVLETSAKERENELLNAIRFADLPKVGNTETQGGIHMGSLLKMAEKAAEKPEEKKESNMGLLVKVAEKETEKEDQFSSADRIKIACAHLTNFIAAAKQEGHTIKEASSKEEIDPALIIKTAQLYVIDSYDLYKEAGISREGLQALIAKIRAAALKAGAGAKDLGVKGVEGAKGLGLQGWEGLKGLGVGAKDLGIKGLAGAKNIAGTKGVQIGGAAAGGLGLGYGLSELIND